MDIVKSIKNIDLVNPVTEKTLAKTTDEKGAVTEHWNTANAIMFVIEQSPARNVETMMRCQDLWKKVKEFVGKPTIELKIDELRDIEQMATSFRPFLDKGILFSHFFQLLKDTEDVK